MVRFVNYSSLAKCVFSILRMLSKRAIVNSRHVGWFGFKFDIPKDHQRPEVGKAKFQPSLGKFTGWFSRLAMSFLSTRVIIQRCSTLNVFGFSSFTGWLGLSKTNRAPLNQTGNKLMLSQMLRQTHKHHQASQTVNFYGILWHTFCQVFAKHLPVACTARGNGKLDFSEFLPLGRDFGSLFWPSTLPS